MEAVLHLSLPVRHLDEAVTWYLDVLECRLGRRREGWADVWFHGMQITLQERPEEVLPPSAIGTRHFGVALPAVEMDATLRRLRRHQVEWLTPPSIQHAGTPQEQWKAKLADPSGNVIEVKSYADPAAALELPGEKHPRPSS